MADQAAAIESLQEQIPSRYLVKSIIAEGAAGIVFLVFDQMLSRDLAIKMLKTSEQECLPDEKRFHLEAKTLALLEHPNIVQVQGFGISSKGSPYLIMEYLKGFSLAEVLADKQVLAAAQFYQIFSQLLQGINYAHTRNVVHRDLKPSNIIICNQNNESSNSQLVKIIDFGIAHIEKKSGSTSGSLTGSHDLLGSPAYMSPEQCNSQSIDARSDLYSLACIMYESLAGRLPFEANSDMEMIYKKTNREADSLAKLARNKESKALGKLIDSSLKKDPGKRPQSAAQMLALLEKIFADKTAEKNFSIEFPKQAALRISLAARLLFMFSFLLLAGSAVFFYGQNQMDKEKQEPGLRQPTENDYLDKAEKRLEGRIKAYEKRGSRLAELGPLMKSLISLAGSYYRKAQYQKAIVLLNNGLKYCQGQSIEERQERFNLYKNLTKMYRSSKRFREAEESARKELEQIDDKSSLNAMQARFDLIESSLAAEHLQNACTIMDEQIEYLSEPTSTATIHFDDWQHPLQTSAPVDYLSDRIFNTKYSPVLIAGKPSTEKVLYLQKAAEFLLKRYDARAKSFLDLAELNFKKLHSSTNTDTNLYKSLHSRQEALSGRLERLSSR